MASPRRIYSIYLMLAEGAGDLAEFLQAKGEELPGTVKLLLKGDRAKLLAKWGDEMEEICGVLDGSHDDPYILEATQTYYWASLYAATARLPWEALEFDAQRRAAATCGVATLDELRAQVKRAVELGPEQVKPAKLLLLWNVADTIYRRQTPAEDTWSLEQIMDADLHEMGKRAYLEPLLRKTAAL